MRATFRLESEDGLIATAFVLGQPSPPRATRGRALLVTAAHALDRMKGERVTLVMRRRVGPATWARLPVPIRVRARGRDLWTRHPRADVAVMRLRVPPRATHDVVPVALLADDRKLAEFAVHPGDELHCLGFPFGAESSRAGFPILRSGTIASYPLLPTRATRVFLFDFRVFRGNSGGPVYVAQPATAPGGPVQFIAGVLSREVMVTERIQELYGTREQSYPLGLAEVVHASLVRETIERLPAR
jgi:hypothetical protein